MIRVGVFVCHCGTNIADVVDVEEVVSFTEGLEDVVVSKDYKYMCSDPGGKLIRETIQEHELDSVVVASCSPRMHEPTFQSVIEEGGLNPYCLEMANIREHCAWIHRDEKEKATEKAKDLVSMAVGKARYLEPLERSEIDVVPRALVIGGGIAGIQAALDIADQGRKVYLVEREPNIGGKMAQLDKTFPTLDCSSCILTPKMMDVARDPNIELLTYSEVEEVDGSIGDFTVKIKKKPTYVDWDKCTGCGECAEVCWMSDQIPNEFDMGMGNRSAIYILFPQTVPLKYTIDPENCIYLKTGKCGEYPPCKEVCGPDAIDHEQEGETLEIDVGSIVVATGYDLLNPEEMYEYGYGKSEDIITNLEFERMVDSSGPTEGKIKKLSDGGEVDGVSFILCVGSRDEDEQSYCCRIGCMGALKHAYLLKEHLEDDVDINICYTDIRSSGKRYEEFYRRIRGMEVNILRGRPSEVKVNPDDKLSFEIFDTVTDKLLEVESDLIVLVPSLVPSEGSEKLAKKLRISLGSDGFFLEAHPKLRPVDTASGGIFIAGCCQGPKDIPDTVSQASGAASKVASILSKDKLKSEATIAVVDEDLCSGCGICEPICDYDAIEIVSPEDDPDKLIAEIDAALCKGCGGCASACPSGAMEQKGFKKDQLFMMVKEAVEGNRKEMDIIEKVSTLSKAYEEETHSD